MNLTSAQPRFTLRWVGLKWAPPLVFAVLIASWGGHVTGWVGMWGMAAALFIGAKWLTIFGLSLSTNPALSDVKRTASPLTPPEGEGGVPGGPSFQYATTREWELSKGSANVRRLVQYFFLWPGMNPRAFFANRHVPTPPIREWVLAGAKTTFGVVLVWFGVPFFGTSYPLVAGWVGMIGLVFLLHFGAFHLLSLVWRMRGVNAVPIMQSPGSATSLARFWGGKWNSAFSDLMQEHAFKPIARQLGARPALCTVFLLSGVLHELVISLPAHGGYGLPTLYFATQGLALLFERSRFGRGLRLGSGWRGWCFVALVSGATAVWLFHPTFIQNVILPMLHAIGAT